MECKLYKAEDYKNGRIAGGKNAEMVIYPDNSSYLERNFIWRLCRETFENDEVSFSTLPDYDRVLIVLDGETVLSHEGERVARLRSLEQDRFDGENKTKNFGRVTDLHLLIRKGNEGCIDVIYPEIESHVYGASEETEKPYAAHGLYCRDGYCVAEAGGQSVMIGPGELFLMSFDEGETPEYELMGEGTVIRVQINYDRMEGVLGPEYIPPEKATFDDFKACVFLANVQFRFAKYIFKSLKTKWFDEQLSAAIHKVERIYLTMIVFVLGIVALCCVGVIYLNIWLCLGIFLAWLVVDCFIVSPLIYLVAMPKPVRRHIKDVDKLTPYEQKVREKELNRNARLERILKKYKDAGKGIR